MSLSHLAAPLLATALSASSLPLLAADLDCEMPGDRRLLRVELPGEEHLCEVSVTYRDGERRVLWYADHDSAFCSEKIDELEAKYTGEWGFSCRTWPAGDGVDALSGPQRRALDRELLARLENGDGAPTSIRVAISDIIDGSSLVAVQWLDASVSPSADAISIYTDITAIDAASNSIAGWQEIAGVADIEALLPAPADGASIERALLTDIATDGSLALTTVVTPPDGQDGSIVCRGRQRVALDGKGGVSVRTPHRHACEPLFTEPDPG